MTDAVERWSDLTTGLRVLVVDDDSLSLKVVGQLLKFCGFTATCASSATQALSFLRKRKSDFDLVLSDVFMPDIDGFKLLQIIGLELDLPVIMMSTGATTDIVLKGVTHGAVDFLIKPVRLEELRNIWQHVVRRKRDLVREGESEELKRPEAESHDPESDENATSKKRKVVGDGKVAQKSEDVQQKRPRVTWSAEMHEQFVNAVKQLGIDKAVPKKILEMMKVGGLTRENVASHLQKYRMYLKRMDDMPKRKSHRSDVPSSAPETTTSHKSESPKDHAPSTPGVMPISCVLPPRVPLMTAPNQVGNILPPPNQVGSILPPPNLPGMGLASMLQSPGIGPFGLGLGMSNMPGANACMFPFIHQQQMTQQLQNYYPEGLPYSFPDISALQMRSMYQQSNLNACIPHADSPQQGGPLYHTNVTAPATTREEECPTGLSLPTDDAAETGGEPIPMPNIPQPESMCLHDQSGNVVLEPSHLNVGHTRLNQPSQMFEPRNCAGTGLPQISSMNSINSGTESSLRVRIPHVMEAEVKTEEHCLPPSLGEHGFNFDAFQGLCCGSRLNEEEKKESMVEFLDEILKVPIV